MDDCRLRPRPREPIELVAAGQSDRGMDFAAEVRRLHFASAAACNTPTAHRADQSAAADRRRREQAGRDVGAYVLFMIIADETDEAAHGQVEALQGRRRRRGAGVDGRPGAARTPPRPSTRRRQAINLPDGAVNFNMGTLVGSYAKVARMLDEVATVAGHQGHHADLRRFHHRHRGVRPAHPAADAKPRPGEAQYTRDSAGGDDRAVLEAKV